MTRVKKSSSELQTPICQNSVYSPSVSDGLGHSCHGHDYNQSQQRDSECGLFTMVS
jgi:hypothetical protein